MPKEAEPKSGVLIALHQVMEKVGYVQKKGENKFHHYKYASEADLLEVLRPAMVEAGLLLIPNVANLSAIDQYGNTNVTVEYTLAHKDGEVWPEKITVIGTGNDKNSKGGVGDKGVYKAMTGANKYLLFKLFQIATGDDPETKEAAEPKPVRDIAAGVGTLPADPPKLELMDPYGDVENIYPDAAAYLSALTMKVNDAGAWWPNNKDLVIWIGKHYADDKDIKLHARQVFKLGSDAWKQAPENPANQTQAAE